VIGANRKTHRVVCSNHLKQSGDHWLIEPSYCLSCWHTECLLALCKASCKPRLPPVQTPSPSPPSLLDIGYHCCWCTLSFIHLIWHASTCTTQSRQPSVISQVHTRGNPTRKWPSPPELKSNGLAQRRRKRSQQKTGHRQSRCCVLLGKIRLHHHKTAQPSPIIAVKRVCVQWLQHAKRKEEREQSTSACGSARARVAFSVPCRRWGG